jgi:hypothetical protein
MKDCEHDFSNENSNYCQKGCGADFTSILIEQQRIISNCLEAKLNKVTNLLRRVIESEAIKEAPFITYSEAYYDAVVYLKELK